MKNVLHLFKNHLNILFCLVFILLFTPVLTANEPATKPTNQEFKTKTAKLHMPFIVNNGQMDERVKFYAKTFGGTVFVTKDGEIVYALPKTEKSGVRSQHVGWDGQGETQQAANVETQCLASSIHSPNGIPDAGTRCATIADHASWMTNPKSAIQNPKSGVALREEFIGSRVKAIQGEEPSVTKVSYFKGNDPSKWKTNISTYDAVNLGEIYEGIELKLRAYGNNVEKLFCVKPGANPEQIKISLNGIQPPESPFTKGDLSGFHFTSNLSKSPLKKGARGLWVNEHGELVAETELGPVKFTKPVAYQEIEGKRVEVEVEYSLQKSVASRQKFQHTNQKLVVSKSRTIRSTK